MKDPFLSTSFSPTYVEVDNDPKEVEYIEIKVKSALHHTRLPYSPKPFYYSLNLYRGCRHGCPYCFARYTHWFLGFQNSFDFQRRSFGNPGTNGCNGRNNRDSRDGTPGRGSGCRRRVTPIG